MAVNTLAYQEYSAQDEDEPHMSIEAFIASCYTGGVEARLDEKKLYSFTAASQDDAIICRFNRKSEDEVFAIAVDEKLLPFIDIQPGFSIPRSLLGPVKKSILSRSTHLIQLIRLDIPFTCQCSDEAESIEAGKSHFDCSGFFPVPIVVGSCRVK